MSLSRFLKLPLHKRWTNGAFDRILNRTYTTVDPDVHTEAKSTTSTGQVDLPTHARVVICGGGVIGTSIAYHLAERGWTDVVLLEQGK